MALARSNRIIDGERGHVPAKAVGNFILDWFEERHLCITQLSLQKIIYVCHVWHLVKNDKPLVRESFQAWRLGPVIPTIYNELKCNNDQPINDRLKSLSPKSGKQEKVQHRWTPDEQDLLESVLGSYGKLTASQLVSISHEKDGPWDRAYESDSRDPIGARILNSDIHGFYTQKIRNST